MRFIKRNTLYKTLMLFLALGFMTLIVGCEKPTNENITGESMVYQLPELGYAYDALEPYVDAITMEIHCTKHFNGYVNNLNKALESHPEIQMPIEQMLAGLSKVPADIRTAIRNNGGCYYNHKLDFSILKINQGKLPCGKLGEAINEAFGTYESFKALFTQAGLTQFGSGWAWLVSTDKGLVIVSTPNQDTPLDQGTPILCMDVWEHAYYLNYQNRRADYIEAFFDIINWDVVSTLYAASLN